MPTVKQRRYPAAILRLALALEKDPEEIAKRIPVDTLRRLTGPMHITKNADGTTSYEHDRGIREGRIALLQTDRKPSKFERGSDGYGAGAEGASKSGGDVPRDTSGRFVSRSK